jgi:hypothetical protein
VMRPLGAKWDCLQHTTYLKWKAYEISGGLTPKVFPGSYTAWVWDQFNETGRNNVNCWDLMMSIRQL